MSDLAITPEIEVRDIPRVLATLYLLVGRFKVHAMQQPECLYHTVVRNIDSFVWLFCKRDLAMQQPECLYHTAIKSHAEHIFISVCVLVYTHMYTCAHTHHTRASVHLSGRMRCNSRDDNTPPHTHATLCMHVYMYTHLRVFIHVQIHMYIYTYTHKSFLHVSRFQRVRAT